MENENILHLVNPANPYSLVGSGSTYSSDFNEEASDQTKAGGILYKLGTAVFLTAAVSHGVWNDVEIRDTEIRRGSNEYRPVSLNNNIQIIDQNPIEDASENLLSVQDQIKFIIKWLNPGGMSGLSTLLQVSRPTIYKWMDEVGDIKLENQRRVALLVKITNLWKDMSTEPLKRGSIKRRLPSGTTLFEILSGSELAIEGAKEAIALLANSQNRSVNAINRLQSAITSNQ